MNLLNSLILSLLKFIRNVDPTYSVDSLPFIPPIVEYAIEPVVEDIIPLLENQFSLSFYQVKP
ncbi:hypothetical protein ACFVSS_02335 [Peribacillus butanolivorans]|uniref:hypothetical protein n=1 Tax=Peribacillus butanolivorans TaxID=421767 RepID=UPI0036DE8A07